MLVVIESGSDASGKATQTNRLEERLRREGQDPLTLRFPDYESPSSTLVKMYLEGAFGDTPDAVNPHASVTFFAVDRFASYQMQWKEDQERGRMILADRYTTSNMVHQAVKILDEKKREDFVDWIADFEFDKLGLPRPDLVLFLDVPPEITRKLLKDRQTYQEEKKDIHEQDDEYLKRSYENALWVARRYGWTIIPCVEEGRLLSIDAIHERVYACFKAYEKGETSCV